MLSGVLVHFQRLDNIGENLVVYLPSFLSDVDLSLSIDYISVTTLFLVSFARIPTPISETQANSGTATQCQQEVVDHIGRHGLHVLTFGYVSFVQA